MSPLDATTSSTAIVKPAPVRPGLDIDLWVGPAPVVSPTWAIGGFRLQFVRLDAHQRFALDHTTGTVFVKVVTGRLANLQRGAYAAPKAIRGTRVDAAEVVAGADGALFTVFTRTAAVPERVTDMTQLGVEGPHAELLQWETFEQKYGRFLRAFDGQDAHLLPGFHLLDAEGNEIAYLFVWTAGKGVDMSTHNHGNTPSATAPAFAEVHWVMHNGTGRGGMYETSEPGAPERIRHPMQQGEEHGPFFHVDEATGLPVLRENGAVSYPWHSWQAGHDDADGQAYDVVAAFEITAPYAHTRA